MTGVQAKCNGGLSSILQEGLEKGRDLIYHGGRVKKVYYWTVSAYLKE